MALSLVDRRHHFVYIHNTGIPYQYIKYNHHIFSEDQTLTAEPQLKSQSYKYFTIV